MEKEISPKLSRFLPLIWWIVATVLVVVVSLISVKLERKALAHLIDRALMAAGDSRRVESSIPSWGFDGVAALAGERFLLKKNAGKVVVFTVNGSGASATLVALYSAKKSIDLILPLGEGSREAIPRLPAGLIDTYTYRILQSEQRNDRRIQSK